MKKIFPLFLVGLISVGEGRVSVIPYHRAGFQVVLNTVDVKGPVEAGARLSASASVLMPNRTAAETREVWGTLEQPKDGQDGKLEFTFGKRTFSLDAASLGGTNR